MITILVILVALTCVALVFFVLVQNSKGGGLASNMGGVGQVQQMLGARKSTDFVQRATWGSLIILVLLTFAINMAFAIRSNSEEGQGDDTELRLGGSAAPINAAPTEIPAEIPGTTPAETPAE